MKRRERKREREREREREKEREREREREGRAAPEGEARCCEGFEGRSLEYQSLPSLPHTLRYGLPSNLYNLPTTHDPLRGFSLINSSNSRVGCLEFVEGV